MNRFYYFFISILIMASLLISGCSSSGETQQEKEATNEQEPQQNPELTAPPGEKGDTIDVGKDIHEDLNQDQQLKEQAEKGMVPGTDGNYAVQIGAFKMPEKAEEVAALARDRAMTNVQKIQDAETGLTKVLVGAFLTKDEARLFRDQIARQYADDYKDAWVTEIPKK